MGIDSLLQDIFKAFTHARPEGWFVIIAIIVPISLFACLQLWIVYKHLRAERDVLIGCESLVKQDADSDEVETAIEEWLKTAPKNSLVTRATRAVWKVRGTPNPDLEAISTMLDQSEVTRLSFARTAPNLLLLAGLLGTVIGLAGSISTLGPQVQNTIQIKDPTELTRNLGVTLQHMQTAFTCTLWGIFMAIIVAMLTRILNALQSNFLSKVQEFMIYDLVPHLIPKNQVSQLADIRKVLAVGQKFLSQISEKMATASERFDEVLSRAGTQMSESLNNLQRLTEDIQTSLQQASTNVQRSAEVLIISTDAIKESTEKLDAQHTNLNNAYHSLQKSFADSNRSVQEEFSKMLAQISQLGKDFGSSTQEIVSSVGSSSERLQAASESFHLSGEIYKTVNEEILSNLVHNFQSQREDFIGFFDGHKIEMSRVGESLRKMNERLRELTERLDPRLLPEADWKTFSTAVVQLKELLDRVKELLEREVVAAVKQASVGKQEPLSRTFGSDSSSYGVKTPDTSAAVMMQPDNQKPTRSSVVGDHDKPRKPWWKFWSK